MGGFIRVLLPRFRCQGFALLTIVKVFEPNSAKVLLTDFCIPSTAVKIPTNDVIPIAMIKAVRTVRSTFPLMDRTPSRIFSTKFIDTTFAASR